MGMLFTGDVISMGWFVAESAFWSRDGYTYLECEGLSSQVEYVIMY